MKTKFNLKTLLVLAILLITMCLFNTNMVQATDVKADKTKTTTDTTKNTVATTTDNTVKTTETQPKADNKTKVQPSNDTLKLIPDTMTVSIKEIEFQKLLSNDSELKKSIMKILTNNNVDMTNYQIELHNNFDANDNGIPTYDIHKFEIVISSDTYMKNYNKVITVKYSNTDKYNENDGKTIKELCDNWYWTDYEINEKWEDDMEKAAINEINNCVHTYDKDIQCVFDFSIPTGNLYPLMRECGVSLYYFKNDVFYGGAFTSYYQIHKIIIPEEIEDNNEAYISYAKDWIKNNLNYDVTISNYSNMFVATDVNGDTLGFFNIYKANIIQVCDGVTISDNAGVTLSAETIKNDNSIYAEMKNKLVEKGYKNIFNAYEIKLADGKIGKDGLTITFNIGTENNGKQAIVLHKKHNGNYEEFVKTVQNGKISITVTELSPFMIAIKDNGTSNKKLDNEPKTGVVDYTIFASAVAIISLGGIAILKFKK